MFKEKTPSVLWMALMGFCILAFVGLMGYWAGWIHGSASGLHECNVWMAERVQEQYGFNPDLSRINASPAWDVSGFAEGYDWENAGVG